VTSESEIARDYGSNFWSGLSVSPRRFPARRATLAVIRHVESKLLFGAHRGANPLQAAEETVMPIWVYGAYGLILLAGVPTFIVFLLNGLEAGAAMSVVAMCIFGFAVFLLSVKLTHAPDSAPDGQTVSASRDN
jgi:hypothetical protein